MGADLHETTVLPMLAAGKEIQAEWTVCADSWSGEGKGQEFCLSGGHPTLTNKRAPDSPAVGKGVLGARPDGLPGRGQ